MFHTTEYELNFDHKTIKRTDIAVAIYKFLIQLLVKDYLGFK